jgi:hypothetical protein
MQLQKRSGSAQLLTPDGIEQIVDRSAGDIVKMLPVALPDRGMERATMAMKSAFANMPLSSAVLECHPDSIVECVIMAALSGYPPGLSPIPWAYLIPRRHNGRGCQWLHYVLSHRAWMDICAKNGSGWHLRTGVIYEGDDYEFTMEPPSLKHVPNLRERDFASPDQEWNAIVASYAAVEVPGGSTRYEVLSKSDLRRRRGASRGDAWKTWPGQMSRAKSANAAAAALLFPLAESAQLVVGETLGAITGSSTPADFEVAPAHAPPKAELLPPVIQGDPRPEPLLPKAALGAMLLSIQGEDPEGGERSAEERKEQAMALLEELTGKTSVRDLDGETVMATWKALGAHLLAADVEAWLGENDVHEGVLAAFKSGKDVPASQAEEGS